MKDAQLKKLLGVPELFGESGFTPTEQRSARPTFEINGLTSGYQGEGSKTIVPAWARAKITCRLVPNQDPEHVRKIVVAQLEIVSAHRADGNYRRAWRGGVSRLAFQPAGAGVFARLERVIRWGTDIDARGRLDSHCKPVQKNPGR